MPAGRDDDALTWDGDDDPTLDVGVADAAADTDPDATAATGTAALPEGWNAVGRGSDTVATPARADEPAPAPADDESPPRAAAPAERAPMGNAELITLGVLGGFSVLYAVGWLIGALRLQGTAEFLVAPVAYQVSLWLAALAPLVWFATVVLLTTRSKPWVRFLWLIGGVLLLVPWPFIMVGVIGR
ncbi:DNA polymerase III subunit gamma/tau [Microbacterium sp. HJ5]